MDFHEALNWRYATKKMNGEQVPQEKVDKILRTETCSEIIFDIP